TQCTTGKERRIKRWEHEAVIDAMQDRLDRAPKSMRVRRATVEHPFGTLKAWMGAPHFKTRRLQSETCDRHPGCRDPDGGHAGLRPRVKSSCFSAVEIRQSKTASRPTIRRSRICVYTQPRTVPLKNMAFRSVQVKIGSQTI